MVVGGCDSGVGGCEGAGDEEDGEGRLNEGGVASGRVVNRIPADTVDEIQRSMCISKRKGKVVPPALLSLALR